MCLVKTTRHDQGFKSLSWCSCAFRRRVTPDGTGITGTFPYCLFTGHKFMSEHYVQEQRPNRLQIELYISQK